MIAETRCGLVSGIKEGSIFVFRGIPYAQPPVGSLRFRPPLPPTPWSGVFTADKFGPMALQPQAPPFLPRAPLEQSEDCLTLNIWTPGKDLGKLPVLLWIHGGGLTTGSGADPYSQGHGFAQDGNLVFVSINYRLGALGFLHLGDILGEDYTSSGNCGILDIVAALRWVQDNIASFGGDPSRVTIGGVSAGAKAVASLFTVPEASDLFQQAILQSGAAQTIRNRQTAASVTREVLKQLGLSVSKAHQLLTLPAREIISAQERLGLGAKNLHLFGPVLDGKTVLDAHQKAVHNLTEQPKKPVLLGTTKSEAQIYAELDPKLRNMDEEIVHRLFGSNSSAVLRAFHRAYKNVSRDQAAIQVLSDYMYIIGSERFADKLAGAGMPVWRYRFDWEGPHGACHGQDIPFVWNHSEDSDGIFATTSSSPFLATVMHKVWIAFVQTGSPGIKELPFWPNYTIRNREVMSFAETSERIVVPEIEVEHGFSDQVYIT